MPEFNPNVWAPWRVEYISSFKEETSAKSSPRCFLCDYIAHPESDASNRVVHRHEHAMMVMNRYPYTAGHLLIAPVTHTGGLDLLSDTAYEQMMRMVRQAVAILQNVVGAQGYNVGMNLGRCAGAGLPDHVHMHVVPRWQGDTNFMWSVGDVRVISESLDTLYVRLKSAASGLQA